MNLSKWKKKHQRSIYSHIYKHRHRQTNNRQCLWILQQYEILVNFIFIFFPFLNKKPKKKKKKRLNMYILQGINNDYNDDDDEIRSYSDQRKKNTATQCLFVAAAAISSSKSNNEEKKNVSLISIFKWTEWMNDHHHY